MIQLVLINYNVVIQEKLKRQICATNSENEVRKAENYSLPDLAVNPESTALVAAQFDATGELPSISRSISDTETEPESGSGDEN